MKINICIINSLGQFNGFMDTTEELTEVEANQVIDGLIGNVNDLQYLAIRHDDGTQSVFNTGVLKTSIIQFRISE